MKQKNKRLEGKRMKGIKITIAELERMVERLKNKALYDNMKFHVIVTEKQHTNGRKYIQFEQPCYFAECNSSYEIFDSQ
jgi:transcriptional antiterminator